MFELKLVTPLATFSAIQLIDSSGKLGTCWVFVKSGNSLLQTVEPIEEEGEEIYSFPYEIQNACTMQSSVFTR